MTNKEIVLKTIKFLKPASGHIDVRSTLWKELELNEQAAVNIRDILLSGELVHLAEDQWMMQLTAKGMLLKSEELNDDGSLRLEEVIRGQKDKISELQIENLTLQNSQLKGRNIREILVFLAGFVSSIVLIYIGDFVSGEQPPIPQEIHLKVNMNPNISDTTLILSDSVSKKTANK